MASRSILYKTLRNDKCCEDCKIECTNNFRKVLDLKETGLVVYVHQNNEKGKSPTGEKYDTAILFNTSDKYFKRATFMSELGNHKVKCFYCKTLIHKVRDLLAEIKCIKGNETIGVCDYCKRRNVSNCKRCEYIVSKFISHSEKAKAEEEMVQHYKSWVHKVMIFLQSVLEESTCEHDLNQRHASLEELQRLLNELKTPLSIRQPDIEMFPILEELKSSDNLFKSKELLEKLLSKFKTESQISLITSEDVSASIRKFTNLMDRTTKYKSSLDGISSEDTRSVQLIRKGNDEMLKRKHFSTKEDGLGDTDIRTLENKITSAKKDKHGNVIDYEKKYSQRDKSSTISEKGKIRTVSDGKGFDKDVQNADKKDRTTKHKPERKNNILKDITNIGSKQKTLKGKLKNIKDTSNTLTTILKKNKKKSDTEKKLHYENLIEKKQRGDKNEVILSKKGKKITGDKNSSLINNKQKRDKHERETRKGKSKSSLDEQTMKKIQKELLQYNKGTIKVKEKVKQLPKIKLPSMLQLPIQRFRELVETSSASVIECADTRVVPKVMIKGESILPLDPHLGATETKNNVPLLYQVNKIISSSSIKSLSSSDTTIVTPIKSSTSKVCHDGVIKFQLSDPQYISKGWTRLPTLRIKRRMNIYKMNPAKNENNWFERNKNKMILYQECEEKFAEIDEEGFGKLYYRNGRIALDYYKATEPYAGYRYVIYSDGEPENGILRPVTILGVFDGIGNGIVYDIYGCERLKYNQSEGVVIDKSIDSPCKWKWHTLNDPPVLQPIFVDTYCKERNPWVSNLNKYEIEQVNSKIDDEGILEIELENYLKEKEDKLLQTFKPFKIKSKTLKLNRQFSLRILQQTDIFLMFRDGRTSIKINLGLLLVNNEIISSETIELPQVFTTYDNFPPTSESVENIQQILESTRRFKKKLNL